MRHNERQVSEYQHSGAPNDEIQFRIQNYIFECCFFVCSCHVWYCTWIKVCGDRVVFCFWLCPAQLSRALLCGRSYLISTTKDNNMLGQHQDGAAGAVSAVQLQELSCRVCFFLPCVM